MLCYVRTLRGLQKFIETAMPCQRLPLVNFLYKLYKTAKNNLCNCPNFSYEGFSFRNNWGMRLLIYARTRGGNKNEQYLPIPSKSIAWVQSNSTNTKYVPTTARKRLRNKLATGHWERTYRKHRLVSRHLPRRKPNVHKILPKWLASDNGLPRFSFLERGQQARACANYGDSACRSRRETKHYTK